MTHTHSNPPVQEFRNASLFKDKEFVASLQTTLLQLKGLTVAHAVLLLGIDVFPQPPEASARGPLQLLDAMQERNGKRMPAGFLDDLAQHCANNGDDDMLDGIVEPIGAVVGKPMSMVAALLV